MKLSKALEGYLLFARTKYAAATVIHYEKTLRKVVEHLDDPELESITTEDLQRYFHFLKTEYKPHRFLRPGQEPTIMSDAGVDGYWKAIRSFFTWSERTLRSNRPDKEIPQPKYVLKEVEAFTPIEIKKLLYTAEWMNVTREKKEKKTTFRMHCHHYKRDVALVMFMLDTGLRIGELCRVRCHDVDQENGTVIVRPFGKSIKSKPRTVFLGKEATHSLWVYMASREYTKDDRLFELTEKSIRQLLHSLGTRTGIDDVHPHKFRHTFAIEFLRNNHDPFSLMRLLGHTNLEMSNHYLNILNTDLARLHSHASPVDNLKR